MTTVFTPTIDIDLRPQPLVPRDPRKLEQVNMMRLRMMMRMRMMRMRMMRMMSSTNTSLDINIIIFQLSESLFKEKVKFHFLSRLARGFLFSLGRQGKYFEGFHWYILFGGIHKNNSNLI